MRINALAVLFASLFLGFLGCVADEPLPPTAEEIATAREEQAIYEEELAQAAERRLTEARRWMQWAEEKGLESGRNIFENSDWYMGTEEFLGIMEAPSKAAFWDLQRARGTADHIARELDLNRGPFDWGDVTEDEVAAVTPNIPCEFSTSGRDGYQSVGLDSSNACYDMLKSVERIHAKWEDSGRREASKAFLAEVGADDAEEFANRATLVYARNAWNLVVARDTARLCRNDEDGAGGDGWMSYMPCSANTRLMGLMGSMQGYGEHPPDFTPTDLGTTQAAIDALFKATAEEDIPRLKEWLRSGEREKVMVAKERLLYVLDEEAGIDLTAHLSTEEMTLLHPNDG